MLNTSQMLNKCWYRKLCSFKVMHPLDARPVSGFPASIFKCLSVRFCWHPFHKLNLTQLNFAFPAVLDTINLVIIYLLVPFYWWPDMSLLWFTINRKWFGILQFCWRESCKTVDCVLINKYKDLEEISQFRTPKSDPRGVYKTRGHKE